jgi:hypothetical protein
MESQEETSADYYLFIRKQDGDLIRIEEEKAETFAVHPQGFQAYPA